MSVPRKPVRYAEEPRSCGTIGWELPLLFHTQCGFTANQVPSWRGRRTLDLPSPLPTSETRKNTSSFFHPLRQEKETLSVPGVLHSPSGIASWCSQSAFPTLLPFVSCLLFLFIFLLFSFLLLIKTLLLPLLFLYLLFPSYTNSSSSISRYNFLILLPFAQFMHSDLFFFCGLVPKQFIPKLHCIQRKEHACRQFKSASVLPPFL